MAHDTLLSRIEAYCQVYAISETTFGARAMNSSKFVGRLREGGSLTLRSLERVEAFLDAPTGRGRQKADSQAEAA